MAKSSTGKRGGQGGAPRRGSKRTRSKDQRKARILTIKNCIKKTGRRKAA